MSENFLHLFILVRVRGKKIKPEPELVISGSDKEGYTGQLTGGLGEKSFTGDTEEYIKKQAKNYIKDDCDGDLSTDWFKIPYPSGGLW